MPAALSYPGVYIEEIPSGVRTITGVATSVAAFVGYTARGLDHRATRIFSQTEFDRKFGGLAADSELSYAIQHFYANGGGEACVVRVPRKGSVAAGVTLLDKVAAGAKKALRITALSRGLWANGLQVRVDYDGIDPADTDAYNLTFTDPATGAQETFAVSRDASEPRYVESIVNDEDNGSQLVSVKVVDAAAGRPFQTGTSGGAIDLATLPIPLKIEVTSDIPAAAPNQLSGIAVTLLDTGDVAPLSVLGLARLVERKVNLALGDAVPGAAVRCEVNEAGTGLRVLAAFDQALLPGTADAKLTFAGPNVAALKLANATADANVAAYLLGTGRTGGALGIAQADVVAGTDGSGLPETADLIGNPGATPPTGLYALEKVDLFNLLVIPDATRAAPGNPAQLAAGLSPDDIYAAALAYAKKRRAFLLIDPPPEVRTPDSAADWKANTLSALTDPNAAAYFPRVRLSDPLNNYKLRTFAPSGLIAGLYARIDASRGVWKAPAGTEATLSLVKSPVYALTDLENGALNPLGLNSLRTFPVYGHVAWGARTLAGADALASEWKYVPVRRLALFLEESLYRGTAWAVFEPNDEGLWAQIRLNLGAFMNNLFRQGAFAGRSAKEAYLVKCDRETTTQDDVNRGIVNILVAFAPLKPAEFVVIKIQQMAGQIQT